MTVSPLEILESRKVLLAKPREPKCEFGETTGILNKSKALT